MQTIQKPHAIQIKAILRKGLYTKCSATLHPCKINAAAVGITGYIEEYTCPDCGKNEGYHCLDGSVPIYFCGSLECLNSDLLVTRGLQQNFLNNSKKSIKRFEMGTIYQNASLMNWQAPNEHKEAVSNWLRKPKNFLILIGAPGTGKTYFCAAILDYFDECNKNLHKKETFYTNTRRFFEHLQKNIGEDKNQYEGVRYFSKREILIFDDLGAAANSDWKQEMLLDLFDYRYENQLPTIITTNIYLNQFSEFFGERTGSRLRNKNNIIIGTGQEDKRINDYF